MNNQDELILEENRRIRQLRIVTDLLIQALMTRPMSLVRRGHDDIMVLETLRPSFFLGKSTFSI